MHLLRTIYWIQCINFGSWAPWIIRVSWPNWAERWWNSPWTPPSPRCWSSRKRWPVAWTSWSLCLCCRCHLFFSDPKVRINFNTSYFTNSYFSFTLKLESRQNFCSNMSIRSSTYGKKYFWNSSMQKPFSCHSFYLLVLRKITNSVTKTTICTWPNWPVRAKILSRFQFEGKTDIWISQVRRVKDYFTS